VDFLTDPWSWWVEPFLGDDSSAMRTALAAALLTAVSTSLVGTWVVLRGMSFLGDALAHGALPGIAIAFIVGFDTTIGAFVAAIALVGGVQLVRAKSPLPDDASIGVMFVGFLALAVVLMSGDQLAYAGDLTRFLFGSVTGVDAADVGRSALAAAVAVVAVTVLHRALLVSTFDPRQARLLGLRPELANTALLVLVAVVIVSSFSTVGSLLVFAFLVAPPAAATLVARRVVTIMAIAVLIGAASSVVGLLVSYHRRTAAGATMALVTVIVFFLALTASSVRRSLTAVRTRPVRSTHA
jgi:ABC-type Mn2+/Zn2+ transport system permease subunit